LLPPVIVTRRLAFAAPAFAALAFVLAGGGAAPARALARSQPKAPSYVPGEILVGYAPRQLTARYLAHATRQTAASAGASQTIKLPAGRSIWPAIDRLRHQRGVLYAVPDYIAHEAGGWIPDDRGNTHRRQGWQQTPGPTCSASIGPGVAA